MHPALINDDGLTTFPAYRAPISATADEIASREGNSKALSHGSSFDIRWLQSRDARNSLNGQRVQGDGVILRAGLSLQLKRAGADTAYGCEPVHRPQQPSRNTPITWREFSDPDATVAASQPIWREARGQQPTSNWAARSQRIRRQVRHPNSARSIQRGSGCD